MCEEHNIPKVYDPASVEKKWYEFWEKHRYFHAEVEEGKDAFSIVIPPPNITGQLHMGHALDNTLQDILIRWHRMMGHNTLWMPGYDHAGLAGVIIGAARRRVPVMVDGVNATAAALLAYGLYPECRDYMLCSHLSSDISHKKMLEILQLLPIVDAGMRLGEGTGASLAIVILQAALDVYNHLSR